MEEGGFEVLLPARALSSLAGRALDTPVSVEESDMALVGIGTQDRGLRRLGEAEEREKSAKRGSEGEEKGNIPRSNRSFTARIQHTVPRVLQDGLTRFKRHKEAVKRSDRERRERRWGKSAGET